MEDNFTIMRMDLRLTECGQESEYCINQILDRNRERERSMREFQEQVKNNMESNFEDEEDGPPPEP